ncbi:twin-arginine translocase TatA/TatE family subunit [Paenibacillus sp. JX-17]|uniref:Sec-independent protein translocase protein TatA n=1 Tax=Paenibacillus lacisoli TaxID=3064525 RepID=A0ABT9CF92_9BACL|nr:twin-arginine translocase TatA/TatE family subunit [Paenibacillus sp. JX-17]MDO7907238.1 twin-arginine translocase TatA/TatE family subunit [Paenibacillus sp. JX-17]
MQTIGAPGLILLVILALLLFGPNKLPELGRAVGRTFREFKNGARDMMADDDPAARRSERSDVIESKSDERRNLE